MLKRYFEDAEEEGYSRECCAKDTFATFVLRSNKAKMMYNDYIQMHDEIPMSISTHAFYIECDFQHSMPKTK